MSSIYDYEDGTAITEGLQGSRVCDEAINMARRIASERGEPVHLSDDDGEWIISPDGSRAECSAEERAAMCCDDGVMGGGR